MKELNHLFNSPSFLNSYYFTLMSDDCTHQSGKFSGKRLNTISLTLSQQMGPFNILLCLMPDDFTHLEMKSPIVKGLTLSQWLGLFDILLMWNQSPVVKGLKLEFLYSS